MSGSINERIPLDLSVRIRIAVVLCAIAFGLLIIRLWYLQVLRGNFFREKSENNRLSTVYVSPPRGVIFDRNGKVLVTNRQSINIELIQEETPNPKKTVSKLAEILNIPAENMQKNLQNSAKRRRFEPKLLLKDVDSDTLAKTAARKYQLPGVIINTEPTRNYLYGDFANHVLGYIRQITKSQLESPVYSGYRIGDVIGQFGIESRWESFLQGKRGIQRVVVNATGSRIGEFSFEPEVSGNALTLTLDYKVQAAADAALRDKKGAIVALDPKTGEVLALTSSPGFNPNMFTSEIPAEEWKDLITGPQKRLSNRAVQGGYPPGSVFKIFVAAAALAEKVITPTQRINCPGYLRFGSRNFRCHKRSGHGSVDLHEAMAQSCDVYFYTVGHLLEVDKIHDYAVKFGLGRSTGLELVEENTGLIPSTEWKKRYYRRKPGNQRWMPGETLSVAIGQGAVVTTPIQIARALGALVNGGHLLKPYLVKAVGEPGADYHDNNFHPLEQGKLNLPANIITKVRDALVGVVNDPKGTGHRAKLSADSKILVAGKTGTAQVVALDASKADHLQDHAWFAGYAPAADPTIVVVALVENGGHGGVAAAPLVKQVMEAHFDIETAAGQQNATTHSSAASEVAED